MAILLRKAMAPRAISRVWRSWARQAGLEDTGTHLGRHYAATTLLASGRASVADVSGMLGHEPSVLLSTYANAAAQVSGPRPMPWGPAWAADERGRDKC